MGDMKWWAMYNNTYINIRSDFVDFAENKTMRILHNVHTSRIFSFKLRPGIEYAREYGTMQPNVQEKYL